MRVVGGLFALVTLLNGVASQQVNAVDCKLCTDSSATCSAMVSCMNVEYRGANAYVRVLGKQKSTWPILTEGFVSTNQIFGFWGTLRGDIPYTGVLTTFCLFNSVPTSTEGCDGAQEIFTLATDCISEPLFPGKAFGNRKFKIIRGCNSNSGMFNPSAAIPTVPVLGCGECEQLLNGSLNCSAPANACQQNKACAETKCVMQGVTSQCRNVPMACAAGMINVGFAAGELSPFAANGENSDLPRTVNGVAFYAQGACCQERCTSLVCAIGFVNKDPQKLCATGRCSVTQCCEALPACSSFSCPFAFENKGPTVYCQNQCTASQCCTAMPKCSSIQCKTGFQNVAFFNEDKTCRASSQESKSMMETGFLLDDDSSGHKGRRGLAQSNDQIPYCSHDICCVATSTCGDKKCGPRAFRKIDAAYVCRGSTCPFDECCAPIPQCRGTDCGYGFAATNVGTLCGPKRSGDQTSELTSDQITYYQRNKDCQFLECCRALPKCVDVACDANSVRIAPLDHICSGVDKCLDTECCAPIPACTGSSCGYGYTPINQGKRCGVYGSNNRVSTTTTTTGRRVMSDITPNNYKPLLNYEAFPRPTPCQFEECCGRLPRCGDQSCGMNSYRSKAEDFVLENGVWSWSACCAEAPKCPTTGDTCGTGFRLKNQGKYCATLQKQTGANSKNNVVDDSSGIFLGTGRRRMAMDDSSFEIIIPPVSVTTTTTRPSTGTTTTTRPLSTATATTTTTTRPASTTTTTTTTRPASTTTTTTTTRPASTTTTTTTTKPASTGAATTTAKAKESATSTLPAPAPCAFADCCERIPTCADLDCGREAVRVKPLSFACEGTSCGSDQCCMARPRCSPNMCSSAFVPIKVGNVCGGTLDPNFVVTSAAVIACQLTECCQRKGVCKDVTCPAGTYRSAPLTQICTGTACTTSECCAALPRCGTNTTKCEFGFKDINVGAFCPQSSAFNSGVYEPGVWKPEPCAYLQCCERVALCGDLDCGFESVRVAAPTTVCAGATNCPYDTCCARLPKCLGAPCVSGYTPSNIGRVCNGLAGFVDPEAAYKRSTTGRRVLAQSSSSSTVAPEVRGTVRGLLVKVGAGDKDWVEGERIYSAPSACSFEECCERIAQCGDQACPATHYASVPKSTQCIGGWSQATCCAPLPTCTGKSCGYGWTPINQGMICYQKDLGRRLMQGDTQYTFLGNTLWTPNPCTWNECCKKQPMCSDMDCAKSDAARIKFPYAVCTGERCTFNECCALIPKCNGSTTFCGTGAKPVNQGLKCGVYRNGGTVDEGDWDGSGSVFDIRRRNMQASEQNLNLPPPQACKWDECCQKLPKCGDIDCGQGAYRTKQTSTICTGDTCTFNECCGSLPRCDDKAMPCGYGFKPINQGKLCMQTTTTTASSTALWVPAPCAKTECCERLPRCGDLNCGTDAKKISGENTLCRGAQCTFEECCERFKVCDGTGCASGFTPINVGMVCRDNNLNDLVRPRSCNMTAECCKRNPTCKEIQCQGMARRRHDDFVCNGACTTQECCAPFPTCIADQCATSGNKNLVPFNVGQVCNYNEPSPFKTGVAGINDIFTPKSCRLQDCCVVRANCTSFTCPDTAINVGRNNPNNLCAGAQCTAKECCAVKDQWGRPMGFGSYQMPDRQTCEFWNCSMINSKEECEYAASTWKIPDSDAAPATKSSSPAGCYFRPEWQTLWYNTLSNSPGNPERRNLCYCLTSVGTPWKNLPDYFGDPIIKDSQPVTEFSGGR